jgi:toxin-antitoxin system PIN domain toxin
VSGYLLDINVVIALVDPSHLHYDRAHHWFSAVGQSDWMTCPIVENAVVRIVCNPNYSNAHASPAVVIDSLASLTAVGRHRFVADRVSLLDDQVVDAGSLLYGGQVTDTYLVALAAVERAGLATFDSHISSSAVRLSMPLPRRRYRSGTLMSLPGLRRWSGR